MNLLKKIILVLIITLLFTGCNNAYIKYNISNLEKELKTVENASVEKEILNKLWQIAYENEDIKFNLDVRDVKGNSIINNLDKALGEDDKPILATIKFTNDNWSEEIQFTPLDIENVKLFLRE